MPAAGATRLAIFDCDGTLIDSQANICTAMEMAFAASGLPPPSQLAVRRIVGLSIVEAIGALLPGGDAKTCVMLAENYKLAFQRLRREGRIDEPLFDGIAEIIATLATRGWTLGVATGKSQRGLELTLAHHGLTFAFATLQTADHHPSKPHPSMITAAIADTGATPDTTVMIGDTSFDMEMAHAAGTRAIGVAWGYHPAVELEQAGAETVAARPADLLAILEP